MGSYLVSCKFQIVSSCLCFELSARAKGNDRATPKICFTATAAIALMSDNSIKLLRGGTDGIGNRNG
jgi:hypothetical protein